MHRFTSSISGLLILSVIPRFQAVVFFLTGRAFRLGSGLGVPQILNPTCIPSGILVSDSWRSPEPRFLETEYVMLLLERFFDSSGMTSSQFRVSLHTLFLPLWRSFHYLEDGCGLLVRSDGFQVLLSSRECVLSTVGKLWNLYLGDLKYISLLSGVPITFPKIWLRTLLISSAIRLSHFIDCRDITEASKVPKM